tara:strand:+ start:295 stop:1434 length:1140 start_codon:yes stop_codon:yes gene_type:complete
MKLYQHPTEKAFLYTQNGSKKIYMGYYSPDGKRRLKSTKTEDLEQAKVKLQEQIFLLNAERTGQITIQHDKKKTVGYIAKQIIKQLEETKHPKTTWTKIRTRLNEIIDLYENYDVRKLRRKELKTIFEISRTQPQLSYLRTALNKIFEYAEDEEYIDGKPTYPKAIIKPFIKKRFPITDKQYNELLIFLMRLCKNDKNRLRKENKNLLIFMCQLLYSTGARVGELKYLKMSDIKISNREDKNNFIYLPVSKTKPRQIIIPDLAVYAIKEYTKNKGKNDYLFLRDYDQEFPEFSDIVRNLKKEHPIFFKSNSLENFVIYNLRHTFITRKIEEGKKLFMISQHCGTSVKMLQEHYSDYIVSSNYDNVFTEEERSKALKMFE